MGWIFKLVLAAVALWGAAFFVYLVGMYTPAAESEKRTDALIVLTGGKARVERGFDLLAAESAPVLFISGVGRNVTLAEMLDAHASPEVYGEILTLGSEIVLDHDASSTQTNASEAAAFVRKRRYTSIRLVTSHYHMPRSLVEFHAALPGVEILREPVVPDSFTHSHWWEDPSSRALIWQEFHKYLAANGRVMLDKII